MKLRKCLDCFLILEEEEFPEKECPLCGSKNTSLLTLCEAREELRSCVFCYHYSSPHVCRLRGVSGGIHRPCGEFTPKRDSIAGRVFLKREEEERNA